MMSAALADAAGAGDAPMEGRVQETCSGGSADSGETVQAPGVRLYEEKEGRAGVAGAAAVAAAGTRSQS